MITGISSFYTVHINTKEDSQKNNAIDTEFGIKRFIKLHVLKSNWFYFNGLTSMHTKYNGHQYNQ